MAWPWLVMAAKSIPWTTLIRRAPEIIDTSARLIAKRKAQQAEGSAPPRPETQAAALHERLRNLEARHGENAEVMEQIAEQVRDLTHGLEVLAARVRVLLVAVIATLLCLLVGITVVLL